MKKVLLDTNAYTNYLKGSSHILDYIAEAETVYMSTIVMGELFAGFKGGSKYRENVEYLKRFLAKSTVRAACVTLETSEIFGEIKNSLKKAGTPLPINDVWIASQAMELAATVITLDSHFQEIPGLRIADLHELQ